MNDRESAMLAEMIEANWPYPAVDDVAERVLARQLAAVPFDRIERAVDWLVMSGREFQPRAPHIFKALGALDAEDRRIAREMAWAERDAQRSLEPEATTPAPPEVREQLDRLRRGVRSGGRR